VGDGGLVLRIAALVGDEPVDRIEKRARDERRRREAEAERECPAPKHGTADHSVMGKSTVAAVCGFRILPCSEASSSPRPPHDPPRASSTADAGSDAHTACPAGCDDSGEGTPCPTHTRNCACRADAGAVPASCTSSGATVALPYTRLVCCP